MGRNHRDYLERLNAFRMKIRADQDRAGQRQPAESPPAPVPGLDRETSTSPQAKTAPRRPDDPTRKTLALPTPETHIKILPILYPPDRNRALPPDQGSPRQIAWARDIKASLYPRIFDHADFIITFAQRDVETRVSYVIAVKRLSEETDATFWIDAIRVNPGISVLLEDARTAHWPNWRPRYHRRSGALG